MTAGNILWPEQSKNRVKDDSTVQAVNASTNLMENQALLGGVAAGSNLVMINKVNFTLVHKGAIKHANALTNLKVHTHIMVLSKDQM